MTSRLTRKWPAIFTLLCALPPHPAAAGSSQWAETEGARLRMVAESVQPGREELRGMLQIELEPGWKTYWREPGAAGIPPTISISGDAIEQVTIHYPVPEWTDDPYGAWAGYKHPVSLPLTFEIAEGGTPKTIEADVFLGICRDVCVPVSAHFAVPVAEKRTNAVQALLLDTAFSALPGGNSDRLSVDGASWTADGALEVRLRHSPSEAADPQLFLSAGASHPFRKPVRVSEDGTASVFRAEPAFDPAAAAELTLTVTARNGIDAVEVTLSLPAN